MFFKRLPKIIDFFKAVAECNLLRVSKGFLKIKSLQAIVKKPRTPWGDGLESCQGFKSNY